MILRGLHWGAGAAPVCECLRGRAGREKEGKEACLLMAVGRGQEAVLGWRPQSGGATHLVGPGQRGACAPAEGQGGGRVNTGSTARTPQFPAGPIARPAPHPAPTAHTPLSGPHPSPPPALAWASHPAWTPPHSLGIEEPGHHRVFSRLGNKWPAQPLGGAAWHPDLGRDCSQLPALLS